MNNSRDCILSAINQKQFIPYIQPILNQEGDICGGEILARWHYEEQIIMPDVFINEIEDIGLMMPFMQSMMDNFLISVYSSVGNGVILPEGLHISLNISPSLLMDEEMVCFCESLVDSMRSDMQLVLEITERNEFIVNSTSLSVISKIKSLGIKLALDDYGTGLSNLISLSCVEFDYIKIDKTFVSKIDSCNKMHKIISNIIDLSKRFNCQIIAEGVETFEQMTKLAMLGVQFYQGYYFYRPMPVKAFIRTLTEDNLAVY